MARDLLAPIPFREVFVILALFLPQLSFVDEASEAGSVEQPHSENTVLLPTLPAQATTCVPAKLPFTSQAAELSSLLWS